MGTTVDSVGESTADLIERSSALEAMRTELAHEMAQRLCAQEATHSYPEFLSAVSGTLRSEYVGDRYLRHILRGLKPVLDAMGDETALVATSVQGLAIGRLGFLDEEKDDSYLAFNVNERSSNLFRWSVSIGMEDPIVDPIMTASGPPHLRRLEGVHPVIVSEFSTRYEHSGIVVFGNSSETVRNLYVGRASILAAMAEQPRVAQFVLDAAVPPYAA